MNSLNGPLEPRPLERCQEQRDEPSGRNSDCSDPVLSHSRERALPGRVTVDGAIPTALSGPSRSRGLQHRVDADLLERHPHLAVGSFLDQSNLKEYRDVVMDAPDVPAEVASERPHGKRADLLQAGKQLPALGGNFPEKRSRGLVGEVLAVV